MNQTRADTRVALLQALGLHVALFAVMFAGLQWTRSNVAEAAHGEVIEADLVDVSDLSAAMQRALQRDPQPLPQPIAEPEPEPLPEPVVEPLQEELPPPEPAPVTTIAWRLSHVLVGVLGGRHDLGDHLRDGRGLEEALGLVFAAFIGHQVPLHVGVDPAGVHRRHPQ